MLLGRPPTKGRLLLATPPLEDPNFDRTVIYVLEHHDEGASGLVLNRPSPEQLAEPLDAWIDLQTEPSQVFSGGPVEPDALIALARTRELLPEADEDLAPLNGSWRRPTWPPTRRSVQTDISALRVFRGYSGWGPGQLEHEIEPEPGWCSTPPAGRLHARAGRPVAHRAAAPTGPPRLAGHAPDDLERN